MFTGLVQDVGRVVFVTQDGEGATLRVASGLAAQLRHGDSVAVGGVCLTATDVSAGRLLTRRRCTRRWGAARLANCVRGMHVNLELPVRADSLLGGAHRAGGHVDGMGRCSAVRDDGFSRVLDIDVVLSARGATWS